MRPAPTTAMILAAGLGTRMRPLTHDRPKALVEVGGRTLIDHMLDRLAAQGVTRAVVNVHAFADRLEAHLKGRKDIEIAISDERGELLETGGGVRKARPLLGEAPIWVCNIDSIWIEDGVPPMQALVQAWDSDVMDDCLLLSRMGSCLGFDGPGDFFRDDQGRLTHRGAEPAAPLNYVGVQIVKPQVVDAGPDGPFSMMQIWKPMMARGRLHGVVMEGFWMHVGDPGARDQAEARMRAAA